MFEAYCNLLMYCYYRVGLVLVFVCDLSTHRCCCLQVACTGLLNWGNVHVCIAHKHLDEAAAANTPLSEVADVVNKEFDAAEVRYKEALAYKPDFFDGLCAMGQLEFERAKLKAGLAVKPVR